MTLFPRAELDAMTADLTPEAAMLEDVETAPMRDFQRDMTKRALQVAKGEQPPPYDERIGHEKTMDQH